jgi:hypothetical protein
MGTDGTRPNSHLFVLRLWSEKMGDDGIEWRGKLQHVTSGDVRYLRDWSKLLPLLLELLSEVDTKQEEYAQNKEV